MLFSSRCSLSQTRRRLSHLYFIAFTRTSLTIPPHWILDAAVRVWCHRMNSFLCPRRLDPISCWMAETEYTNILVAPVCLSILLNLVFLCNIVRVLLMKLKSPAGSQGANAPSRNILQAFRWVLRVYYAFPWAAIADSEIKLENFVVGSSSIKINLRHDKACFINANWKIFHIFLSLSLSTSHCVCECNVYRATLLLVPLLGMQYILTPFKPEAQHRWEFAYEIVSAFTASFQVKQKIKYTDVHRQTDITQVRLAFVFELTLLDYVHLRNTHALRQTNDN